MRDIISFSVSGSDSIHELQLGQTLIRFTQFDLAYFRDQCVTMYRKNTPDEFMDKAPHLKEYLHSCHPYCKAMLSSDFDKIALDCVIDDICLTEGVGLGELWVRSMSEQDRLGQAIFRHITEYKSGHAINQWTNLVRMQSYALSKMTFIYNGADMDGTVHKARKLYYDLAFVLTAAELGFDINDLPRAETGSAPFLKQAGTIMKTAVNAMTPVIKALTEETGARTPLKGDDCVRDQMAGIVINTMTGLRLPEDDDIGLMISKYGALPGTVYVPSGFKAIIDLEFDQLLEKGFYVLIDGKNYTRLKYSSKKEIPDKREPPVTGPEKVSRSEAERKPDAMEKGAVRKNEQPEIKEPEAVRPVEQEPGTGPEPRENTGDIGTGRVRTIIKMAEDPGRKPSQERTLQEVNMRCNLIWMSMNVQTGWNISPEDASEWFRYLTRLRYEIGTGGLTPESLDKFLDATLEVYKLLPETEQPT